MMTTTFYTAYLDYTPWMIYSNEKDAVEFIGKNEYNFVCAFELDCGDSIPQIIHICEDRRRQSSHYFVDLIDAIRYADQNDIKDVYSCSVDEFDDPNIITIDSLFENPIIYISILDLSYRISNKMDSKSSFREALSMWFLFGKTNKEIIDKLIEKYPDCYQKRFTDYCLQYERLNQDIFVSVEDFMSRVYSK